MGAGYARPLSRAGGVMRRRLGMLRRHFVNALDRLFIPCELLVRADGRVRYVKVSRRRQMAAAAVVTGFAGWTLASTAGLVVGGFFLSQQSAQRHQADVAYAQLRAQVAASRARFVEMTAALSSQQQFLLDLVRSRSNGTASRTLAPQLGNRSPAETAVAADPVQQTLSETAANLAVMASNNQALEQQLTTVESHVGGEAREHAAASRDRYAVALQATAPQFATQRAQVASLTDAVTALRNEVAALAGARARAVAARDYFADAWYRTDRELAMQREQNASLTDQV